MNDAKKMLLEIGLSDSFNIDSTDNTDNSEFLETKQEIKIALSAGQKLNQYSILKEIGHGGMGVVYSALDTKLNRKVALKVMFMQNEKNAHKLIEEAKFVAQLSHPNIINIYEVCETPICFFAMELIDGISLDEYIHKQSKQIKNKEYFDNIINIFITVAEALHFAHRKKIIHRDIKPENIMLDKNKGPVIMDFGLAKIEKQNATMTTELAGTPIYMSPEQAKNKNITTSTDIYSLGATFYEAITTQSVFQGDTALNILFQIINNDPIRPKVLNPKIPIELEAICFKCLEKKTQNRYSSMKLLVNDLKSYRDGKAIVAKINTTKAICKFIMRYKIRFILVMSIFITLSTLVVLFNIKIEIQRKEHQLLSKEKEKKEKFLNQEKILNAKYSLQLAFDEIHDKKLHSANEYLKKAINNYSDFKFENFKECIEINWLKNKIHTYQKKITFQKPKKYHLIELKNKVILISKFNFKKVIEYDWNLKKKEYLIKKTHRVLSCAVSPNEKYLAILHRNANSLHYVAIYDLQGIFSSSQILKPLFDIKLTDLDTDRYRDTYAVCYFDSNGRLFLGGMQKIKIFNIKNLQLILEKEVDLDAHSEFSVNSFTQDKKKKKSFYSIGQHTYSLNDPRKYIFTQTEIDYVCEYNDITNKLIISSSNNIFFLDLTKDVKKQNVKEKNHTSKVIKIKSYNDYTFTMSEEEIFVWDKEENVIMEILNGESLVDFVVQDQHILCITKSAIYMYDCEKLENPKKIKDTLNIPGNNKSGFNLFLKNTNFTASLSVNKISRYNFYGALQKNVFLSPYPFSLMQTYFINSWNNKIIYLTRNPKNIFNGDEKITNLFPSNFHKNVQGYVYDKKQNLLHFYDKDINVITWDLKKEKIVNKFLSAEKYYNPKATITPDGKYIIFILNERMDKNGPILVLELKSKTYRKIILGYYGSNVHVKIKSIRDKNLLLISYNTKIKIWDFDKLLEGKNSSDSTYLNLNEHNQEINCFDTAQHGKRLISIDKKGGFFIWDISDNASNNFTPLLLKLKTDYYIKDCVYVAKLKKLITVGEEILIWDFKRK